MPSVVSVSSGALSPLSQDDGSDFFGPGMTISNSSTPRAQAHAQPTAPPLYGGVAMTGMTGMTAVTLAAAAVEVAAAAAAVAPR